MEFLKKISGFEFFINSKKFFITAFSILFISIISTIIFFMTGNIPIIQSAFEMIKWIVISFLGVEMTNNRLSQFINKNNENSKNSENNKNNENSKNREK